MESPFLGTREELQHVQMDIKHVQAVQINHSDRILRLEKRQADDAALKSVWGTGSPFPSVLSGTPQQGPVQNPSNDVFDDFDDEQGQNLLSSLQLEADGEPLRRGTSRANSVRFDVSALQGSNWAQNSRASGEFGPVRPGSGLGSHPMTERSLSHKSDGRHSSAGHSVHSMHSVPSGRTSSLGLDTNFIIGGQDDDSLLDIPDPPPGLFILGSVPSIIRCWLNTNFSHNALLYAVVCTGSRRSVLDYSLVKELQLLGLIQKDTTGRCNIKLPVYLPEAIITQPTSRSNSPAPQLPTLTADFDIVGLKNNSNSDRKNAIRVFLGSDTLRAHNADILFSQNLMTLYGDDRNKLSVPFVRPEDQSLFNDLCTANISPERNELKANELAFDLTEQGHNDGSTSESAVVVSVTDLEERHKIKSPSVGQHATLPTDLPSPFDPVSNSDLNTLVQGHDLIGSVENGNITDSENRPSTRDAAPELNVSDPACSADSATGESVGGIWGSWRHGSASMNGSENGRDNESTSGYQRATRGRRSMKVLKASKSSAGAPATATARAEPSATTSTARNGAAYEPLSSHSSAEPKLKAHASGVENEPLRWAPKRLSSDEQKGLRTVTNMSRSPNPVGSASAFAWMNSSKPKASFTRAE